MRRLSALFLVLSLSLVLPAFAADTYTADPAHSSVGFKIKHMGLSTVRGQFTEYTGKVSFDKEDPAKSSVEVIVQAKSVDTANSMRDAHLRKAEFFNVEKFPTLSFKSTAVKKIDDSTYEITGNFTLLGVSKPVTFQFVDVAFGKGPQGDDRAGGNARFKINRNDYGMTKSVGPGSETVEIELAFEAIKS